MYRIQVIEIICRLLTVPSELVNPPALVMNAIERERDKGTARSSVSN